MITHISYLVALELFAFGLLIGTASSAFGVGGGLLVVPIFMLGYGMPADVATASSLGVIVFSSLSGTIAYLFERRIDFRVAALFMASSIPGSVGGALLSNWLRARHLRIDLLQIAFALTMIVIAVVRLKGLLGAAFSRGRASGDDARPPEAPSITSSRRPDSRPRAHADRLHLGRRLIDRHGRIFEYEVRLLPGTLIAFGGGLLGALLGLGGGIVYVPVLTIFLGVPAAIATATSTFTILAVTPIAAAIRWTAIDWGYVLLLSGGVVISAGAMPRLIHRVNDRWVLTGFWIIAIAAALRLLAAEAGVRF